MSESKGSGDRPAVLLLGVNTQALKVARSLGRRGIPVHAIAFEADRPEHRSRYLRVEVRPETQANEWALLRSVRRSGARLGGRPVLIPMTDDTVLFVARHADSLAADFRFLIPPAEVLEAIVTKEGMARLADEAGIPQPRTHVPRNEAELESVAAAVRYPVMIKPVLSTRLDRLPEEILHGVMNGKVARAENREELLQKWRAIAAHEPALAIQEEVVGPDDNLHYYVGYFGADSEPRASFVGVKERLLPIHYGSASCAVSRENPEVVEQSVRFMQAVGYRGHVGIEYKLDPRDGAYKLIEVNARFGLWDGMASKCGIDFAWLNYDFLTGGAARAPERYRSGVRWISMQREVWSLFDYRREDGLGWTRWLRQMLTGPRDWAVFAMDDPMPFLLMTRDFAADLSRWMWGRIRRKKTVPPGPVPVKARG